MTVEQIEKFLENEVPPNKVIRFEFKKRDPVRGVIVKGNDYDELKRKNFWRIVTQKNLEEYQKSQSINLAKIFNGVDFAKLSFVAIKSEE